MQGFQKYGYKHPGFPRRCLLPLCRANEYLRTARANNTINSGVQKRRLWRTLGVTFSAHTPHFPIGGHHIDQPYSESRSSTFFCAHRLRRRGSPTGSHA